MRSMRKTATVLCIILGLLAVVVAQLTWWVNSSLLDREGFTRTTVGVLSAPAVRSALADEITARLNSQGVPVEFSGQVNAAAQTVVGDPRFIEVAAFAISEAHRELLDGDQVVQASIDLGQFQTELRNAVAGVDPNLVGIVPSASQLGTLDIAVPAEQIPDFAREAGLVRAVVWISILVGAGLLAVAVVISTRRPRILAIIGAGLIVTTLVPVIARAVVPRVAVDQVPGDNLDAAARALVEAFFWPYVRIGLLVGAVGLGLLVGGVLWGRVVPARARRQEVSPAVAAPTPPAATAVAPQPAAAEVAAQPAPTSVPAPAPGSEAAPEPPAQSEAAPETEVSPPAEPKVRLNPPTPPPKRDPTGVDDLGWAGKQDEKPSEP